jgi:hypothetical protein
MKFDNCTRCQEPIMNRQFGGVGFVQRGEKSKRIDNLCADCARREEVLQDSRAAAADEQAERSGV